MNNFHADKLVDLLEQASSAAIDYIKNTPNHPVIPNAAAIENLASLKVSLPSTATDPTTVLNELSELGTSSTVRTTGGRYFGFVTGGTLPVGLAANWLAASWDQNAALHVMSPLATALESVCEKWLIDLFALPKSSCASFVTGSSVGNICALAAARHHIYQQQGWDVERRGLRNAPDIQIVASAAAHSSIAKAVALLGLGTDNIIAAAVDEQGRVDPRQLPQLSKNTILILQAGNVNSGSFDPFAELCNIAKQAGAWVHIDGAFGLWAAACAEKSHLTKGIELADSWVTDAHKTLNASYDSGIVFCRHAEDLSAAMAASGSYIQYSEQRDPMLMAPEMSRRGRAIELYAILKTLGQNGINDLVSHLCGLTNLCATLLSDSELTIDNDVVFNQLLVRLPTDEATTKLLEYIQASGELWCGGARWQGNRVIRISICAWASTDTDVKRAVEVIHDGIERVNSA